MISAHSHPPRLLCGNCLYNYKEQGHSVPATRPERALYRVRHTVIEAGGDDVVVFPASLLSDLCQSSEFTAGLSDMREDMDTSKGGKPPSESPPAHLQRHPVLAQVPHLQHAVRKVVARLPDLLAIAAVGRGREKGAET